MGLYFNFSIVLFYILFYIIYVLFRKKDTASGFKLFSFKRYFRYVKLFFTQKVIVIIVFFSIISNSIVLFQNYKYDNLYNNLNKQEVNFTVIVVGKDNDKYKVKVQDIKYKNTYLYILYDHDLKYGDKIEVYGKFYLPKGRTNYKGFDYKEYLKTLKIYGTIYANKVNLIKKDEGNFILKYTEKLKVKIEDIIDKSKMKDEEKGIVKGLVLGDKTDITEEVINDFSLSNISHILAISGLHISYIIIISSWAFDRLIGKHFSKIVVSFIIIIYMCLTNFSPSVVRAGITGIIHLMGIFLYRKDNIFNSLSLSLIILLIYNPFLINSIGLKLSFVGTIGIIVFYKNFNKFFNVHLEKMYRKAVRRNLKKLKIVLKILNHKFFKLIKETIILTISATLAVMPIVLINFNKVSLTSLIISVLTSFIIGPIVVLSLIFIVCRLTLLQKILSFFIDILLFLSNLGANLPLNQIYIITPNILQVMVYYIFIFTFNLFVSINLKKSLSLTEKRIKNLVSVVKYKLKTNKNRVISVFLIITISCYMIIVFPRNLKIYFIDVGQGDSSLIITPKNKSILIDGGGSENFDVGKNTLVPYLLDRKIICLDYVFISHFDTDHVGGILYLLQELKVKNVIIGKQFESSNNYELFLQIIKKKKIKVNVVEMGSRIYIEKNVFFDILWPDNSNKMTDKIINNNALVCKLNYKTFSCIFTGDIEKEAEKILVSKYKDTNLLKSTVLKVAHHGSNSSSTIDFLNLVRPKIALIGVGENNLYGHPSYEVIKKLKDMFVKIYRTDEDGEIMINVNKKGKIILNKFLN